ncbi:MAG: acyl-CoA carboxylase subunit beta [Gammaproteobacteria bacterium]|jgi:acetyl-CoA carboxylase carboxyltransferase component|nr:MAG: acyl-CoA carboxylase subunit beta [Gammaproteobacteria bacterium]
MTDQGPDQTADPARSWDSVIAEFGAREAVARAGGGADKQQEQRARGRLTARERIETLLDAGSFTELNTLAEHQCRDFGMDQKVFPGDGVITGHGTIAGRRVFVFSEDETVLGGSMGRVHGEKIHYMLRLAREMLAPVIGLYASGGARIQEGMDNVYGVTGMFYQNALNSGVVPQIAAIMGTASGGGAYSPALCDFILQIKGTAMFLTGPAVIKEVTGEEVSFEDLGGTRVHASKSGVVHLTANDDRHCLETIRELFGFLPQNNRERPPRVVSSDPVDRQLPELTGIVPIEPNKPYDMRKVIRAIADDGGFFEIHGAYARNIVVGFIRIGGGPVGVVANNPQFIGGCLDLDAADKAARFIRTCDAYNIPLLTLADTPGFRPGIKQEHAGIIRHGAKMLYAWTEASVPKVIVILRKLYGGSIPAMGVHEIGFDQVFAWPAAEMQMVGAEAAVRILYRREIAKAPDPDAFFAARVKEYQDLYLTPYHSAGRKVVDAVIAPADTRRQIHAALAMLENKTEPARAFRKHGNIPL